MHLLELIEDYGDNIRPGKAMDLDWLRRLPSLADVIAFAAMARTRDGRKHPHQGRLKNSSLEKARDVLLANQDELRECRDFDDLLGRVEDMLRPVSGLGELYFYDTAFKIGVFLGKLPEKVYLHAGVRDGAKGLGLAAEGATIDMSALPPELRGLEPHEVEDFLCIYKRELASGLSGNSHSSRCASNGDRSNREKCVW